MEYNKRHPERPIAGGVAYGDFHGAHRVIEEIGHGKLPLLGLGSKHASEQLGETGYAMHCKGVELPAYLPHTNPGYPFALAGGHMSMRTYLLLLYERETSMEYWVKAITERGWKIMRDDLTGACKFCGLSDDTMVDVIRANSGLDIDAPTLERAVLRTYLRGYKIERRQGFKDQDYALPREAHLEHRQIQLPYFITEEFFGELRTRVLARFDEMLHEEKV
jgi:aldehyde:ferredoxin oxidoreductase